MLCSTACQMRPLTVSIDSSGCVRTKNYWIWWYFIPAHFTPVSCLRAYLGSCCDGEFLHQQSLPFTTQKDIYQSQVVHDFCLRAHQRYRPSKPPDGRQVGFRAESTDGKRQTIQDYRDLFGEPHGRLTSHCNIAKGGCSRTAVEHTVA